MRGALLVKTSPTPPTCAPNTLRSALWQPRVPITTSGSGWPFRVWRENDFIEKSKADEADLILR